MSEEKRRIVGGDDDWQVNHHDIAGIRGGPPDDGKERLVYATNDLTWRPPPSFHVKRTGTGPRCLILCFDGTGNEIGYINTNAAEFTALLWKNSCNQPTYYQPGLGFPMTHHRERRFLIPSKIDKLKKKLFGPNVKEHIMRGYEYIMAEHEEGDRISCLASRVGLIQHAPLQA